VTLGSHGVSESLDKVVGDTESPARKEPASVLLARSPKFDSFERKLLKALDRSSKNSLYTAASRRRRVGVSTPIASKRLRCSGRGRRHAGEYLPRRQADPVILVSADTVC